MQPLTRGPEASDTAVSAAHTPHTGCAPLKRRRHSAARSTCAAAFNVRSSPLGADMVTVQGQEQLCRRALQARAGGLGAADRLVCEDAVCTRVRDRVLRRCHAAPKRCGSEQSSELATQAHPSQPHSRLMMPVHVGGRLAIAALSYTPTTQDTMGLTL